MENNVKLDKIKALFNVPLKQETITDDFIREVDLKMIEMLKFQNEDLTNKLQTALTKYYEAEYRAKRAEENRETFQQVFV